VSDAADGGGQHGAARPLPDGWTDWDVGRVEAELQRHNRLYWERNAPEITDYDYDRLVEALRAKAPDSPILEALGEPVPEIGSQVRHAEPMLSLDKCYSEEDLLKWAEKFEGEVVMTPKIDGVACSIRYGADGRLAHAATRGSGVVGEDITQNVLRIRNVPPALEAGITRGREVEVRGEVYLPLSVFAKLEGEFANPRNTAAGAIKHKDAGRSAAMGLRFFAYNVMGLDEQAETMHGRYALAAQLGFEPVEFDRLDKDAMQAGYDAYVARRESLDYEIDGVVFIADDIAEHVRMGATAHHPRYAIAYKLQGESATTVLREVEWSVSRSRALTPVGIVDPVKLSGATVTRISLHNWGLVQSKNLSIGARVVAMRRGGVIPYLEAVVEPGDGEIRPPETCPSCESPTLIEGDFVYCGNESGCRATAIETLKFFARAIDIEGFGAVWLETLFDAGLLRHPQDFFRLRALDLLEFERMGRTLANKLVDNIAAHREVPLATFMTALGVPGLRSRGTSGPWRRSGRRRSRTSCRSAGSPRSWRPRSWRASPRGRTSWTRCWSR
jgi:DNA ligase (NAD+)